MGGNTTETATVAYDLPGAGSKQQAANQQNMGSSNSRLEDLANHSTFSVEELDAMDDETIDKLEASLEVDCGCGGSSNGGDGGDGGQDGTNNGGGDDGGDDKLDAVLERLDQIEDRVDETQSRRRDELIEAIEAQTRFDEDDLADLGIAENVDKLERFAEKQNAQVETTPNYGGRAAGTQSDDGDVDLDSVQVGGAFATMDAADAGGD
jgi:TATA-binding protein-associated factor Taf7